MTTQKFLLARHTGTPATGNRSLTATLIRISCASHTQNSTSKAVTATMCTWGFVNSSRTHYKLAALNIGSDLHLKIHC